MTWIPDEKEIDSIIYLDGSIRFEYFIKKIADAEMVYSLYNEGWSLAESINGKELIPIWPHEKYANLCAFGNWEGFHPKEILLDDFIEKWLPGIDRDNRLVSVFPTHKDRGVEISAYDLILKLKVEINKY